MERKILAGVSFGMISAFTALVASALMMFSGLHIPSEPKINIPIPPQLTENIVALILLAGVVIPAVEEFIFRFIPITITKRLTKNEKVLWTVIIASSAFFGYLHGSVLNIFIQGLGGFIYSIAFLRGGYIVAATAHITANSALIFLVISALTIKSILGA